MVQKVDLVMDFQYGSTGKGLIAGYLAKRDDYDTVVCSFATNAGHTYIDQDRGMSVMTQQLPTGAISSPTVKNILIGPGALIHKETLLSEIDRYSGWLQHKNLIIHPHAAVVEDYHAKQEIEFGMTKIGSTAKGCGAAAIERIRRDPSDANVAKNRFMGTLLAQHVATQEEYLSVVRSARNILVEGAQGFSLSMYHGQYPFTTSRDVTPWQIMADCGLPFNWSGKTRVIGTMRTFPIRVNNRDGSSGPCYPDQLELDWSSFAHLGVEPELTTVTKLQRRIFTFSQRQALQAAIHCAGVNGASIFLNFANYCDNEEDVARIIDDMEVITGRMGCPLRVRWTGWGPDDKDVRVVR